MEILKFSGTPFTVVHRVIGGGAIYRGNLNQCHILHRNIKNPKTPFSCRALKFRRNKNFVRSTFIHLFETPVRMPPPPPPPNIWSKNAYLINKGLPKIISFRVVNELQTLIHILKRSFSGQLSLCWSRIKCQLYESLLSRKQMGSSASEYEINRRHTASEKSKHSCCFRGVAKVGFVIPTKSSIKRTFSSFKDDEPDQYFIISSWPISKLGHALALQILKWRGLEQICVEDITVRYATHRQRSGTFQISTGRLQMCCSSFGCNPIFLGRIG